MKPAVALAVLSVTFAACGHRDLEQDRPRIRIGYTRYLTMAPMFVADAAGFFEEQGLEVELVPMRSAATSIPALTQGQLDVVPGPMSPSFFNAIYRGAGIRLVGDKGSYSVDSCSPTAFVVSPALGAQTEKVLPKRASWGREPFSEFRVERVLAHFGFDIADVEQHHVPLATRYEAVVAGRLDGAHLSEPFLGRFRSEGGHVWIDLNEVVPGHQFSVFAFGPRLLEEDRELGRRVAIALLRGLRRFNLGKTPENVEILSEALGWERELLEGACWPTMRDDGRINFESIDEFQRWSLQKGDLDALLQPAEYADSTFMAHARRTLDGAP